MGANCLLLFACAALWACVKSSSNVSDKEGTRAEIKYPIQLHSAVGSGNSSVRVKRRSSVDEAPDDDRRNFFIPTALVNTITRRVLPRMMGSNSPFMESLASRVLEWHLNHLVQLKRSPTDVAILLRLRKDESIFVSQKVKLLKLYTELFYPPPLSKAPFLHAVAMGFGGEAEFAPFLFKFAVLNSGHVQAEEWLNTLFIKWHYDGKTFEEAFELLEVKEVGSAIFSSRYLALLGQYRDDSARHTEGQEVRTLCSLLKPKFGGDAKLAVLVYEARHTTEAANVRQGVLFDLFTEWVEKEAKQRDFRSKLFSEMANINEEDSKAIKSAFNIFRKGKRVAD